MRRLNDFSGRFRSVIQQILLLVFSGCSMSLMAQNDFLDCFLMYTEQKYEETANCLTSILDSNPIDVMALNQRAYCYLWLNQPEMAIRDLSVALLFLDEQHKYPSKDNLFINRARAHRKIGNYIRAFDDYAEAQRINPMNVDTYIDRGFFYLDLKCYDASAKEWQFLFNVDTITYDPLIWLAKIMIELKELDRAIEVLDEVENRDIQHPLLYKYRSDALYMQGDHKHAIDDAIDYVYFDQWKTSEAQMELSRFYDIEPDYLLEKISERVDNDPHYNTNWLYVRADFNRFKGRYREAIEDYNTIEKLNPDDHEPVLYIRRGNNYLSLGDYDKAITEYDIAIKIEESYWPLLYKAKAKFHKADYQAAILDYTKAISCAPDFYYSYYMRGWTKTYIHDYIGALEDYNTSIDLDPNYAYTYFARGEVYKMMIHEPQLAEDDFNKILTLENEIFQSSNCRQYALLHLGRIDEAIAFQNEILEKYPTSGNYYDAACLYSYLNRQSEAIESLNKSFEKGNRDFIKCEHDRYLENIRKNPEFERLIKKWKTDNKD
ncbi:MAG: tetratricopeptide repeat protein [Chitinophagales bacterium]|nr:tetratricopeptide repeat protein [Chitinophagales bacterium]